MNFRTERINVRICEPRQMRYVSVHSKLQYRNGGLFLEVTSQILIGKLPLASNQVLCRKIRSTTASNKVCHWTRSWAIFIHFKPFIRCILILFFRWHVVNFWKLDAKICYVDIRHRAAIWYERSGDWDVTPCSWRLRRRFLCNIHIWGRWMVSNTLLLWDPF